MQDHLEGNILVIDDDPAVRRILEETLFRTGYMVKSASGGYAGLRNAEEELPDLILLDIRLSDIDGIEVCRRLKARESTAAIPVVFISALHDGEDKIRGFAEGGVDYVTKPFGPEEILARVATHLTIARSRKQIETQNCRLTVSRRCSDKGRLGYEVTAAQSSAEALEVFTRDPHAFDMVITDQIMPGMTGTLLVEELMKVRPDIPVILYSGRTDLMSPRQARKLGIAAYVTKPFSRAELARAVRAVLERSRTHGEEGRVI